MLTRFSCRAVSVFFRAASLCSLAFGIWGVLLQFTSAGGFNPALALVTVWAFILGVLTWQSSGDAWRLARDYY